MDIRQFLILISLIFSFNIHSQIVEDSDLIDIFLDCQWRCDQEYFRQEMGFVNFMQNRQEAEVFMQLLAQRTGTRGIEFQLFVKGQEQYEGTIDTLVFYTEPDDTENQIRDAILDRIKHAVLPFLVQSPLRNLIQYSVLNQTEEPALNTAIKDPWNYWTFRYSFRSFVEGQSQSSFFDINNSFSANRTTEEHKFNLFLNHGYNRSSFNLNDGEKAVAVNESFFGRILYVNSISDHWSLGISGGAFSSTFRNVDFGYGFDPTIEYNVFPYTESAQHQFTIRYNVGPSYRDYTELTVFDKLEEWYWEQQLEINYAQVKDWGTIELELEYENFLHDFNQLQIGLNPELDWNVTKGLSISLFGRISYIANLRNIQQSDLDNNDILLQNRQLDTSFGFFARLGLTYRFGSAYNNIVNTRF